MLKAYIFNEFENSWIEENIAILNHDVCAILDEEQHIIYIWKGLKSSKVKYRKAIKAINILLEKNPDLPLKLENSDKNFPSQIKGKLNQLLQGIAQEKAFSKYLFSRFFSIRLYLISLLIAVILPLISLINLATFISWIPFDNNFTVMAEDYTNWLKISSILIIIAAVSFIMAIFIGIFEQEYQTIIFSSVGLLICIGITLYLQQGIFLFIFQEGSTDSIFLINNTDLYLFFSLVAGNVAIFEIPNIIKLRSFIKTYKKFIF
jgi:hypothetical protein